MFSGLLNQWGQCSRSTGRLVLENGRLRRPERFFAGFAQVAFPQEKQLAQNLQKRGSRGFASVCTGLLPHALSLSFAAAGDQS